MQNLVPSEHKEQCAVIRWADYFPLADGYHVGDFLFAIPNGGDRNSVTAARLKQEGVRAGVPDLLLALPRGNKSGLFIEMKRAEKGKSTLSPQQKIWLGRLKTAGYAAAVCYGSVDAIGVILHYLEGKFQNMPNIKPSNACKKLIKEFEGLCTKAYRCPAGVLTIGYGHTGEDVVSGQIITEGQADALLDKDLKALADDLSRYLEGVELTQNQADALLSFVFNVGVSAFAHSTVLKELKAGDYQAAADALLMWNKITKMQGGKKVKVALSGLTNRRKAERALFLTDDAE